MWLHSVCSSTMGDQQEARLSCGSLSPIHLVRTKQCPRVLVTHTENNNNISYTDLDQLICRNQMSSSPQSTVSRALPRTLVLASITTAVLGLSAGLCIGFIGIEIGLPLALLGVGLSLSVIFMSLRLYRKWSRQGYQTIPGEEFSPSQL